MTLAGVNNPSPVQGPGPTAPLADVIPHRFTWSALTSNLQAVVGSLGTLVQVQQDTRQEASHTCKVLATPKPCETLFWTRLNKLMRYC